MSRFVLNEVFWRTVPGSELVAFGRNYEVFVYERGTDTLATLWSAEVGGVEVAQPLRTNDDGQAVGKDGNLVWLDYALYDVACNGERFAWPPFSAPIEGGSGGVESVNGDAGPVVVLDAIDVGAQPADSDLAAIAALTTTAFGRALLELNNAAAGRTALGLGTAATQASAAFDPAGAAAAAEAAATAALAGKQPLDSDLTALAALATTAYGRSLLEAANAAALRNLAGLGTAAVESAGAFQPIDADLTAIAALSTTAFGRGLLEAANAAALRTLAGLGTAAVEASSAFQPADSDLTAIAALTTTTFGRSLLTQTSAAAARGTLEAEALASQGTYFSVLMADNENQTAVANRHYYAQVVLTSNATITGVAYFVGEPGATGNVKATMYDAAGTRVAQTTATVAQSATGVYQKVAFSAPAVLARGVYYVGLIFSGAAKFYGGASTQPGNSAAAAEFAAPTTVTLPTVGFYFVPTMTTY